jgi:hypothetical protein
MKLPKKNPDALAGAIGGIGSNRTSLHSTYANSFKLAISNFPMAMGGSV